MLEKLSYEILPGGKCGKEEEAEKKPQKCIKPEPMKTEKFLEEPSAKIPKKSSKESTSKMPTSQKVKSSKATPTTQTQVLLRTITIQSFSGPPYPPKEKISEKLN